jgi:hypothetical protein
MALTTHLKLPLIAPAQALKHITHNEAIAALDGLVQLAVLDRDQTEPLEDPEAGQRHIVASPASGAWTGHGGEIARFDGAIWVFHQPEPGWLAYVLAEERLLVWTGSAWEPAVARLALLGINTEADDTNRLAVKSDAVLLSHDDVTPGSGDVRVVLNKAAGAGTASLMFQTGWSGRAEFGTAGDDKLHLKVSADGATWTEALVVDPTSGFVGVGTGTPAVALDVAGPVRVGSFGVGDLPDAGVGAGQVVFVTDEVGGATLAYSDGADWRRVRDGVVVG